MIIGVLQDQASRSIDVLRKFVDSLPTGGDEHQLGLEKVTLMEQQRSKHEKLLDVDKTISALTPDAEPGPATTGDPVSYSCDVSELDITGWLFLYGVMVGDIAVDSVFYQSVAAQVHTAYGLRDRLID